MSTPSDSDQQLEILERNEVYEDSDEGFHLAGILVVYQMKWNLYHAMLKAKNSNHSTINAEDLQNVIQIPVAAYNPKYSIEFTEARETMPNDVFVKRPQLISYDRVSQSPQPNLIAENMLKEARLYELLMRNPHLNIATYLGCQVSNGTITGLCLKKYSHTLMKEVNPHSHMKRKLRATRVPDKAYSLVLTDVESGIKHLHSLGLVHNDLNSSNIMIDNDRGIIIDLDSCRRLGESLEGAGRTFEWYDEKVQRSRFDNDLKALEEIRTWLGVGSQEFQFDA
ncbi:hypothetical protein N7454_002923 [Penicillium verhagenii]|nr:hypothetical protein N7454_002923 [Penicillium verhagenii]